MSKVDIKNRQLLIVEAFEKSKQEHGPLLIQKLRNALVDRATMTTGPQASADGVIGGSDSRHSLEQRKKLILYDPKLIEQLLLAKENNKRITYALPKDYRNALCALGYRVNYPFSAVNWSIALLKSALSGLKFIYDYSLFSLQFIVFVQKYRVKGPEKNERKNEVFFEGVPKTCMPWRDDDTKSFDIFSWHSTNLADKSITYLYYQGSSKIKCYTNSGDPVIFNQYPFRALHSLRDLSVFILRSISVTFKVVFDSLFETGDLLLIFRDLIQAQLVKDYRDSSPVFDEYYFQSNWVYQPVWVKKLQRQKDNIVFYFYSTNSEGILLEDYPREVDFDWRYLPWTRYIVWNEFQRDFLMRGLGEFPPKDSSIEDVEINVTGPVWFQTAQQPVPKIRRDSIVVFDVAPLEDHYFYCLGATSDYLITRNVLEFWRGITEAAKRFNLPVYWKAKRQFQPAVSKEYRNYMQKLVECGAIEKVCAEAAPQQLVTGGQLSICFPFTSVPNTIRGFGGETCYFDPVSKIAKHDPGAHGIDVVSSQAELEEWIQSRTA